MAHVIKFHPAMALLEQYVDGSLSSDMALAVAAHVDLCPHCQRLSRDINADQAAQQLLQPIKADNTNWQAMLDTILSSAASTDETALAAQADSDNSKAEVSIANRQFPLPRALQRLAAKQGKWLQLGGIASAKLPAGRNQHVSLLYIGENTEVPQHTHLGLEVTLVLAGRIVDEYGEYHAGDLLINTPADTHTPRTLAGEDCLCLSVLSAPLQFKKGLVRLLNPLQQLFY